MRNLAMTVSIAAACLALGACGGGNDTNTADANATTDTGTVTEVDNSGGNAAGSEAAAGTTANASFPKGARIVEENGKTYRIDADGTRVELTDGSRIVTENGVRYRVDPGGTRVRIDPQGAAIDVDLPDVDLPDVDVGINNKGNPDIDVKSKSDGDSGPN